MNSSVGQQTPKPVRRLCLLLACIFGFFFTAFSQRYLVHHYNEVQGLMAPTVYDVVQDDRGQLWFTTRLGVTAYDGISWKNYTQSEGLPGLGDSKISIDPHGSVWVIGSSYNRILILRFEDQQWREIPTVLVEGSQFVEPTAFAIADRGGQSILAAGTEQNGLFVRDGEKWFHHTVADGLSGNSVNGVAALNGRFYVATDGGLSVVSARGIDNSMGPRLQLPPGAIKGIGVESKERLKAFRTPPLTKTRIWLYGDRWLGYFNEDEEGWTQFSLPVLFSAKKPRNILLPDYQSGVFIGGYSRIFYFNYRSRQLELFDTNSGLIGHGAHAMYIDFEGNIWITGERGVSKIASRRFGSFRQQHGLLEDEVTAILEYEPGKFIFGHNFGVTFYDGKDFDTVGFVQDSSTEVLLSRVLDMKKDSQGNIWLAAAQLGLCRIDPERRLTWYGRDKYKGDFFNCLWIDQDDTLWVGTLKTILTLRGDDLVPLPVTRELTDSFRKIHVSSHPRDTRNAVIYLATVEHGLYVYKDNRWRNYQVPNDRSANSIYAVGEDHQGQILLGTRKGVYVFRDETLNRFKPRQIQLDRAVFFILEDGRQNLWFGTDNGVVYWDGQRVIKYAVQQGLIGQETNRAAAVVDSQGRVWIGTSQGVSVYNEEFDHFRLKTAPPRLELRFLETVKRQIPLDGKDLISLPFHENSLFFHFRGISFLDERSIRFRHRLEDVDRDWSPEHYPYNQVIQYKNLSPGIYRFFIQARNAVGVRSPVVQSGLIVIASPFYRTWWFYVSLAVVAALVFFGLQRYFSVKRYSSLLEKHVAERTTLLKAAEERYFKLFEESKDAVLIISPTGKFIDVNPAGLELFGYPAKGEMIKANIFEDHFIEARDRDAFRREIESKGFVKDYELLLRRKNGWRLTVLVTANAVKGIHGEFIAYRGIFRDISERRRLKQQLEQARKMEVIGKLAGSVAHDLNNTLSGLINYPEVMLLEIPETSPLRQMVLEIKNAGEKAAATVRDLLALSMGSSGEHQVVNLNDVIAEYLKSPEHEALKKSYPGVHFDTQLAANLSNIMGSPFTLLKAVMNLVSNGAEAIQARGRCVIATENVRVRKPIKGFETVEAGEYAVLRVTDDGIGIPAENINKIFEPFYTAKIENRGGTGLGMSVVWAAVKDHRALIDVESKSGAGTTFKLYFPKGRRGQAKI